MAKFFGWSRPLHESLPLAGAALEAGSASEPLGTPVVDVPTQPTFLLGTAMDLHGDAETLRVSVPMQTPGPAPALAPSPGEEKEKITAMPVAGRRSSGAVGVSASATAAGVAELSGAASAAGGGGELALCHVASARSFAVRGALPAGGDSVDGDGGTSGAVAGCEVEAGVTAPRSGPGSLSVRFAQIAAMSVPVEAERASLATDVVRALTAEVVTPDVHRALPVGVVQSVSSPQTASVSLTHQHELQRAMITSVDSDKAQSHRLQSSAEATGGSDNGITNLESAGALLQQERALIVSQSDVGSQLQQVCEAQVPRRSTASSVDDGGLGGLQRLEIWTGKSQRLSALVSSCAYGRYFFDAKVVSSCAYSH